MVPDIQVERAADVGARRCCEKVRSNVYLREPLAGEANCRGVYKPMRSSGKKMTQAIIYDERCEFLKHEEGTSGGVKKT
jgi:hypothetical protein